MAMGFNLSMSLLVPSISGNHNLTIGIRPQMVASHRPRAEYRRRSANYKPTSWSYEFLRSFKINNIHDDKLYKGRVAMLESRLKMNLASEKMEENALVMLKLIDDIQRLGLAYRFGNDIHKALDRFLSVGGRYNSMANKSIHVAALGFRLLRQNGYQVSQDFFEEYVNEKSVFLLKGPDNDGENVLDMLSLYEASFLGYEGEDLLDKAREHTTNYLNSYLLKTNCSDDDKNIRELVRHSRQLPLHRRMEMLEARWYIEAYKKTQGANLDLLELAKLEFNMAQSVLQRDIKDVSWWWKSLGLAEELSFSRDRLVECFFWTVGMMFQPQFSSCRKGLTKVTSFITTIDDIYDIYGTLEELKLFTDVVERWDLNSAQTLPNYMKPCYFAFHNTITEMACEAYHLHGENVLPYLTKVWVDMLKAFLKEAEWSYKKSDPPSFSEYLENGWRSVSGTVILVHTYYLLNDDDHIHGHVNSISKQEILHHLINYDKIIRWPSIIFRLCNDLATSSAEIERGETVNAVTCYMNENGVSEDEARAHINSLIDQAWKNMNQELQLLSSPIIEHGHKSAPAFAKSFVRSAVNLARIAHYTYQRGDSHGNPDAGSKNTVFSLIFQPIVDT